jgi:hypothetical protein
MARFRKFSYPLVIIALIVVFISGEHWQQVPTPGARVVMEKWHRYDHFWYPVAKFEGFSADEKGNLNLQYCQAAVGSWKVGDAKNLTGSEIYRCREQSSWRAFWQWSRDREAPEKAIAS